MGSAHSGYGKHNPNQGRDTTHATIEHDSTFAHGKPEAMHRTSDVETETKAAASSSPPDPPPNGGIHAWLQVLGSWMMIFNTWGTIVTFGDYQTFYEAGELFTASSSNISWIGSIQSLMVFAVGAVIGPVYDRGHLKLLLVVGSFGIVFGHMMLSLCNAYWQAVLAQGFVVGIGGGCLFVPALAVITPYFDTRLGLAMGVAATGSSVGGVIYPIVFTNLIDRVGFAWTTRVIGFIALGTLTIPLFISQMRLKPPGARKILDLSAFTDGPYMLCILGCFLGYTGSYTAFFYLSYFAQSSGFLSTTLSLYLVPIMNAASAIGRILPNWLADKVGPINVITPGALMVGILLLCNLAVHNAAGIICTAIFFGFLSGIFIATPPLLFVALTEDKLKLGTRMGMAYAMVGLSVLPGGPGSGAVLQHDPSRLDWTASWTYAGVVPLAAFLIFCILRVWKGGLRLRVKV